jgi:tetratricopeptide (TPR) repeat protein
MMDRHTIRAVILVSSALGGLTIAAPAQDRPQTFRSGTDVVFVDASVRDGGRVVTGLTAADFVLTDNGVRQQVDSVEASAVPLDVTLAVDLSGNARRPWQSRVNHARVTAGVQDEVNTVARILRPGDRLRLVVIDTYVRQVWPMTPADRLPPVPRLESDGLSAVYDGLAAAVMYPVEPARRHVVVARTKGRDTISSVSAEAVGAITARTDALAHVVVMETALANDDAFSGFQCRTARGMGLCWPTNRFWVPHQRRMTGGNPLYTVTPEGSLVKSGVEATGGGWHQTVGLAEPSLTNTFRRTFEDFRTSYMLRYSPRGVVRGGWHSINVTVSGPRNYTVRARRGYGIDDGPVPPVPPPPPLTAAFVPRTLPEFVWAFERGGYQQVVTALERHADPLGLLREFDEGGNPWPAAPKREAVLALDLIEPALFSPRPDARDAAVTQLDRFAKLIRHPLEPEEFERLWHFAAICLLQGAIRPADVHQHVDRALARFPDTPQFVLARAIASEQRSVTARRTSVLESRDTTPAAAAATVAEQYRAAAAFPETAAEARIRLGYVLVRAGRFPEALAELNAAGAARLPDAALAYLHRLFLGLALNGAGRADEALTAFREADRFAPGAQAARVALMNALLRAGDRQGAETIAEEIQSGRAAGPDPWWRYWQGQFRFHPNAMAALREMVR